MNNLTKERNLQEEFIILCNTKNIEKIDQFISIHGYKIDIDEGFKWSCAYGYSEVAKYLLKEQNANIHADDSYAIRWVCINEFNDLAKYLLTSPELTMHADMLTAFLNCCDSENNELIEFIICEGSKATRDKIEDRIQGLEDRHIFKYPKQLLDKMKLIDNLNENLPLNKTKQNKSKI